MPKKLLPWILVAVSLLSACAGGENGADAVATIVAATLQAQAPEPDNGGLQAATGTVEGTICFPIQGIPEMTLYLQAVGAADPVEIPITLNQSTFSAVVPADSYTAFAWLPDYSFGGSYSQMVTCGLTADCTDHTLIEFNVPAGGIVSGVDVCDWYGEPGSVPFPTGADIATGSISGVLSYPSEFIPSMDVVAFHVNNPANFYYVVTVENAATFQIDGVPAGSYFVVAYPNFDEVSGGLAGGYSAAVQCGLSVECTDHSLLTITVSGGNVTSGVSPADWYAPEGFFPANPVP